MTTVTSEAALPVDAERAWALLRRVEAADEAFPGILTGCRLDDGVRTVTFANGMVVRERIISIDEARRRIAYTVVEGRFSHHNASMQIVPDGPDRSRFFWISDFLPDEHQDVVRPLVEQGTGAFLRALREGR